MYVSCEKAHGLLWAWPRMQANASAKWRYKMKNLPKTHGKHLHSSILSSHLTLAPDTFVHERLPPPSLIDDTIQELIIDIHLFSDCIASK